MTCINFIPSKLQCINNFILFHEAKRAQANSGTVAHACLCIHFLQLIHMNFRRSCRANAPSVAIVADSETNAATYPPSAVPSAMVSSIAYSSSSPSSSAECRASSRR